MSHLKTVARTIFYQFFCLFTGLSVGFILNPEWVGHKQLLIEKSIANIFFPIQYNEQLDKAIKGLGAYKIYITNGRPDSFKILEENLYYNEEWYWCKFQYKDKDGNIKYSHGNTRIKWKTWEYYFDYEIKK